MKAREDELSGFPKEVGGLFRVGRELGKEGLVGGGRRGCCKGRWFTLEERNSSDEGVGKPGTGFLSTWFDEAVPEAVPGH